MEEECDPGMRQTKLILHREALEELEPVIKSWDEALDMHEEKIRVKLQEQSEFEKSCKSLDIKLRRRKERTKNMKDPDAKQRMEERIDKANTANGVSARRNKWGMGELRTQLHDIKVSRSNIVGQLITLQAEINTTSAKIREARSATSQTPRDEGKKDTTRDIWAGKATRENYHNVQPNNLKGNWMRRWIQKCLP